MNSILTSALVGMVIQTVKDGWSVILLRAIQYVPVVTQVPRFIFSLRKLHARDLRGGLGSDIDTAFGLTSTAGYGADVSMIVFADGRQNEGLEQGEEIQMEDRQICSADSDA